MDKTSIIIADDHSMIRMGLMSLLGTVKDFTIVGEAEDGKKAVEMARRLKPDIILMDIMMPKMDGIEATRQIVSEDQSIKVILLTSDGKSDSISNGIKAGAKSAILKSSDFSTLVSTIRSVAKGEVAISPEIRQLMNANPPATSLSARQQQILDSISMGLNDKDVATQLGISVYTVKEHINTLFAKLGAANRAEAVAIALRKHLLKI